MDFFKRDLSAREVEILKLSADGKTDKAIAQELGVSLGTVHTYWTRIRGKCNGRTRAEIIAQYIRASIKGSDKATSKIEAESRFLRQLVDSLPHAVMYVNSRMQVAYVNATFLTYFELGIREVVGQMVDQIANKFGNRIAGIKEITCSDEGASTKPCTANHASGVRKVQLTDTNGRSLGVVMTWTAD